MSLLSLSFALESCHILGLFVPLFSTFRLLFFMISLTIKISFPSLPSLPQILGLFTLLPYQHFLSSLFCYSNFVLLGEIFCYC